MTTIVLRDREEIVLKRRSRARYAVNSVLKIVLLA